MIKFRFFRIVISILFLITNLGSSDACDLNDSIIFKQLDDNTNEVFWTGSIGPGAVTNPHFDTHSEYIEVEVTSDGLNTVLIRPGPEFINFLDLGRNDELSTNFTYDCLASGETTPVQKKISVTLLFVDTNTRPPTFNKDSLAIKITTNWDKNIALNWDLADLTRTSDLDYAEANANNLELTFEPAGILTYKSFPQWQNSEAPPPPSFDHDIQFSLDPSYPITAGTYSIQITASNDGLVGETLTMSLEVELENLRPPEFDKNMYQFELAEWPTNGYPLDDQPIIATDPDDSETEITYSLGPDLDFLTLTNEGANPPKIVFNRPITEEDGLDTVIIGEITATESIAGAPKSSSVAFIIKFPPNVPIDNSPPVFTSTIYKYSLDELPVEGTQVLIAYSAEVGDEDIEYALLEDNPGLLTINPDGIITFIQEIPEELDIINNVLLVTLAARVEGDASRQSFATIAIMLPIENCPTDPPTTTPEPTTCKPCDWTQPPPCTTTTPEPASTCPPPITCPTIPPSTCEPCPSTPDPETGTCPPPITCPTIPPSTCEPCPSTPDPETGTCPPPITCPTIPPTTCAPCDDCPWTPDPGTGTCPPPSTCAPCDECPLTPDPGTGTCPPPITCPTIPPTTCAPCDDCPWTPDPGTGTCPPPITCPTIPPTTCAPCDDCPWTPDPGTGTCPPPITCPTSTPCEPCTTIAPTTSEPCTCPTAAPCTTIPPSTSEPCTCPTAAPCTTIPPNTCPPCDECPLTPDPGTGTCPPPITCPTSTPCEPYTTIAPTTSEPCTCPTAAPCTTITPSTCEPCPWTPDPGTGTCPPPVTCPTSTPCNCEPCEDCPWTPDPGTGTCPPCDCPTSKPSTSEKSSNTGMIAGLAVLSILSVGAIGAAGFFFWKLKNVSSAASSFGRKLSFAPSNRGSFSQGRNMRANIIEPEERGGFVNPSFSNAAGDLPGGLLQEIVTHPEPILASAAIGSAAAIPTSSTFPDNPSSTPVKSALAKPKEILPDYEEVGPSSSTDTKNTSKPRTGGVTIDDKVSIIEDTVSESEDL